MSTLIPYGQACFLSLVLVSVVCGVSPVAAQNNNPNRALQEKLQRVQKRVQVLEQEKTALQSQNDQSVALLKGTQRDVGRLQAAVRLAGSLKIELAQQTAEVDSLMERLATAESKMADLQVELKREQGNVKTSTHALQAVQVLLDGQNKNFDACKASNQTLFELNVDLLKKYEAAYKTSSVWRGGFVTQLDWVRVENENSEISDHLTGARVR